jgi:hypothetical protein
LDGGQAKYTVTGLAKTLLAIVPGAERDSSLVLRRHRTQGMERGGSAGCVEIAEQVARRLWDGDAMAGDIVRCQPGGEAQVR